MTTKGGGYNKGQYAQWMYFSTEPVVVEKWIMGMGRSPKSSRLPPGAMATMVSTKTRKKVLEAYVDKAQVTWCGAYTLKQDFEDTAFDPTGR